MNPYALLPFTSCVVTAFLGAFVHFRNPSSPLHRLFMLACLAASAWAFTEFGIYSAETPERAIFWMKWESLWPMSVAFLLHFILIFTENTYYLKNRLVLFGIYAPAVAFSVITAVFRVRSPIPHPVAGWTNTEPFSWWYITSYVWGTLLALVALALCYKHYRDATSILRRKSSKHVLLGLSFPVILGITTELLLPTLGHRGFGLATLGATVMSLFVGYAMWRYELFSLTPSTAAESIITTMSDALFLVNTDNVIQTVNNSALKLLSYEHHELVGHPMSRLFPTENDSEEPRMERFAKMLKTGVVGDVETTLLAKGGKEIPVSLSWSTTRSRDGKTVGVTFIGRDITERIRFRDSLQKSRDELEKRVEERTEELQVTNRILRKEIAERMEAEEGLAAEKEYLAVTLRSIGDAVIATDRDGNITFLNNVAEELTGWPNDQAAGKHLTKVFHISDERTGKPCEEPVARIMQSAEITSLGHSLVLTARDGTTRTIDERGAAIMDGTGKIRGAVLVFRDVSEQKRMQDEIFKTRKLESVALLAGGIAHDFNNILTGIMTNLFVARTQMQPGSETCELLADAEKAAFRASSLTKQLLAFSKGTSPIRERMPIREVIEDSVGFCLSGSSVDYKLTIAKDLAEAEIDRGQIDQSLNAIITNAEEAMPDGGALRIVARNAEIDTHQVPSLDKGTYVAIEIKDEGSGIPEALVHRIFDPYFTTKTDHNGLGLTMAYSVLRKHGGTIEVRSEENAGSTFTVYLPACREAELEKTEQGGEPAAGKARILLMDDEGYIRKSTTKLLTHLGYEATAAVDGNEAVSLFRQAHEAGEPFHVVILDLTVPGGSGGKEALEKLKAIDPGVKALLSSGYVDDPVMTDYRQYGFSGVVTKPYEVEELSEMLRSMLSGRSAG